jgi:hypothetical protein
MQQPIHERAFLLSARVAPWVALSTAVVLGCTAVPASADQRIGSGGFVPVANGTVNLGCTDLVVAGTLDIDQGTYFNVRNVHVLAGGVLNGGAGSLTLSGSLSVDSGGQFNRQQLALQTDTACGKAAPVTDDALAVPTLANAMLAALAALLLLLAQRTLNKRGAVWHRRQLRGAPNDVRATSRIDK